ncbi:MAG: hypothetical protein M3Y08_03015 [Fibrobacterota bacterium]|nr:hypothetical protein [Fibrobacterota bacterium]
MISFVGLFKSTGKFGFFFTAASAAFLFSGTVFVSCSSFGTENFQVDPGKFDDSRLSPFGSYQQGTSWKYEIHWIRWACSATWIRNIKLESVHSNAESIRLIYKWWDYEKESDSAWESPTQCKNIDSGAHYDTVSLDVDGRLEIQDSVQDEKNFESLKQMSFFQVKAVPTDTQLVAVCDSMKRAVAQARVDGQNRKVILDTTACLNSPSESLSFNQYGEGIGLLRKQWGYTDQRVIKSYTWITLLEYNGRAIILP